MAESMDSEKWSGCACLLAGLGKCEARGRFLGSDATNGRFGEVSLFDCPECGRIWLFYRVEYEAFSGSGRWFRGVISDEEARAATPETAAQLIARSEYQVYGGSYFGTSGVAVRGPRAVQVDLSGPPVS